MQDTSEGCLPTCSNPSLKHSTCRLKYSSVRQLSGFQTYVTERGHRTKWGYIGDTWRTQLNSCFLWPTWVHNPNGKSIGLAVLAQITAVSPYTLHCSPLSSWNCLYDGWNLDPADTWFLWRILIHSLNDILIVEIFVQNRQNEKKIMLISHWQFSLTLYSHCSPLRMCQNSATFVQW